MKIPDWSIRDSDVNMQRDQAVVQVLTAFDMKSDDKSVQNNMEAGKQNTVCNDGQSKLAEELDKETFFKKFGGMLMALAASFFFSVSFLIIKILANHGFKAYGCSVLFNVGVLLPCFIGILIHELGPRSSERSRIFKEIWPLTISNKNTTFKILLITSGYEDFPISSQYIFSVHQPIEEHDVKI
ncbi:hypothetical protein Bhyg_07315 [Pseudolycoriella hygida]|uniref:Uncharacterized protein n=1 Tax=Pseudolycoriella hygida TaxID=35572 RepID=A0A9Q0N2F5_9DIPT|nr:hypothetical protein Bhyg_07315 [Pseudolycoriella hygida]